MNAHYCTSKHLKHTWQVIQLRKLRSNLGVFGLIFSAMLFVVPPNGRAVGRAFTEKKNELVIRIDQYQRSVYNIMSITIIIMYIYINILIY